MTVCLALNLKKRRKFETKQMCHIDGWKYTAVNSTYDGLPIVINADTDAVVVVPALDFKLVAASLV
jgi:hypothetical protein